MNVMYLEILRDIIFKPYSDFGQIRFPSKQRFQIVLLLVLVEINRLETLCPVKRRRKAYLVVRKRIWSSNHAAMLGKWDFNQISSCRSCCFYSQSKLITNRRHKKMQRGLRCITQKLPWTIFDFVSTTIAKCVLTPSFLSWMVMVLLMDLVDDMHIHEICCCLDNKFNSIQYKIRKPFWKYTSHKKNVLYIVFHLSAGFFTTTRNKTQTDFYAHTHEHGRLDSTTSVFVRFSARFDSVNMNAHPIYCSIAALFPTYEIDLAVIREIILSSSSRTHYFNKFLLVSCTGLEIETWVDGGTWKMGLGNIVDIRVIGKLCSCDLALATSQSI